MSNAPKVKANKIKLPKQPEPRQLPDIEADYGKLVAQAGQAQYNVYVFTKDLERINDQLKSLNYEAAARNERTKKEQAAKASQGEVNV